jgi:two-component system, chemotaxis family, protein-glutamate methylesterase/glutaminase
MSPATIRVLVVDDDEEARGRLVALLRTDPALSVAGAVADGQAAVDFVRDSAPDVVLMDTRLPKLDGFEATRAIMENWPLPIVMCSDPSDSAELSVAFHSMEAGAVSCIPRPPPAGEAGAEEAAATLLRTLRLMAEVKVVRRWPRSRMRRAAAPTPRRDDTIRVVGVGASTGGPPVLQAILAALPKNFPVPILVVQHISRGFLSGLADWLAQTTGFRVLIGSHGVIPAPGHVYLAPDDFHMGLAAGGILQLSRARPENSLRPAVSFLFRSLAEHSASQAIGVLLSGMGKDGAAELGLMRERGAVTLVQDRETSVVHGMPGEAIACGAAAHVLPADGIGPMLARLVAQRAPAGAWEQPS